MPRCLFHHFEILQVNSFIQKDLVTKIGRTISKVLGFKTHPAEPDKNKNSIVSFCISRGAIYYISLFHSMPEENANKRGCSLTYE